MNITEQAAQVLREIDEALALAEKATPGPWFQPQSAKHLIYTHPAGGDNVLAMDDRLGAYEDAAFIATSRTLLPASLQIIRDDIKAWLELRDSLQVGRDDVTTWDFCNRRLTAILDAWEAAK
jgi:hypothetical protein